MRKFVDYVKGGAVVAIISYGIAIFVVSLVATFVFAAISYAAENHLQAIATTGLLAAIMLAVQTMDRSTFRPRNWNWTPWMNWKRLRTALNTLFVGVAIHYSAIIIGVSFGAVFAPENGNNWDIVAVLVQQAVLTRAAWVLVNEYRHSNTAMADRNAQGG